MVIGKTQKPLFILNIQFDKHALREKCPNTEFFLVRIQSECGKIRTRKNFVFGYISHSDACDILREQSTVNSLRVIPPLTYRKFPHRSKNILLYIVCRSHTVKIKPLGKNHLSQFYRSIILRDTKVRHFADRVNINLAIGDIDFHPPAE